MQPEFGRFLHRQNSVYNLFVKILIGVWQPSTGCPQLPYLDPPVPTLLTKARNRATSDVIGLAATGWRAIQKKRDHIGTDSTE
jgi:hypothetical protein